MTYSCCCGSAHAAAPAAIRIRARIQRICENFRCMRCPIMDNEHYMTNATPATTPTQNHTSFAVRWYILIMMCMVYTLSIADRYCISTVLEPIRIEFGLNDFQVSLAAGVPLAIFYVVFGFPLS